MNELTTQTARKIIELLGHHGVAPEYGIKYFTCGLDDCLFMLNQEYLSSYIKEGGSAFKMVIAEYGGGKTHFLRSVRDIAWKNNFMVAEVTLNSTSTPFYKLELIYKAIVISLTRPLSQKELLDGYEKGIDAFIKSYYGEKLEKFTKQKVVGNEFCLEDLDITHLSTESISFGRAIKEAFKALIEKSNDDFDTISSWLKVENPPKTILKKFGIFEKIDKTTAFSMIRSLVQWIKHIGYSGLLIMFDEGERQSSISSKQRDTYLSNLRELIDECAKSSSFRSVMIFYAVPDMSFLEGRTRVYEALRQRLETTYQRFNPSGVQIKLSDIVGDKIDDKIKLLQCIGNKLSKIYEKAYNCSLELENLEKGIKDVAQKAINKRFSDEGYMRIFMENIIRTFHSLRIDGKLPQDDSDTDSL